MNEVSTKILRSGWQDTRQGYPKDFDGYHSDVPGRLHRASYKTFGGHNPPENEMISETAYSQRKTIQEKPEPRVHHSMVNFLSFPTTLGKTREEFLLKTGILLYPDNYGTTDYLSVMKDDYKIRAPAEREVKKYIPVYPTPEEMYKTTDKFRRLIVDGESPRRCGMNKFYDENMFHLDEKRKTPPNPPPYALHYDPKTKEEFV